MALFILTKFGSEGFQEEADATADSFQINSIGMVGTTPDITGLSATPPTAGSAASKAYVDASINGLDWKDSVRLATDAALPAYTASGGPGVDRILTADAVGILTVDGVATVLGDRILHKDAAGSHVDHGIFFVDVEGTAGVAYVLKRALDADEDAEFTANMSCFASEGTANADKAFTCTTNDTIVVDTTATSFSQFSSVAAISAGAGLLDTSSVFSVELDTAADAQGAGTGGGSSGLEFDAAGVGGQLRAQVNATGGIERTATGIAVELDGSSLTSSAAGLKVGHAPRAEDNHELGEAVALYDPVSWGFAANELQLADAAVDAEARVIGVAMAGGADGAFVDVIKHGIAAAAITGLGATGGERIYLDAGGGMVLAIPGPGNRIISMGTAKNATDLDVQIHDFGKKAA